MNRRESPWLSWLLAASFVLCGIGIFSEPSSDYSSGYVTKIGSETSKRNYPERNHMGENFSEENDVTSIFTADSSSAPSYEVVKATAASLPKERPAEIETVKTVKLRYGDTFGEVLKKAGVKPEQIERGMVALSKVFNPSRVKAGREVNMEVKNGDLISLSLKPRPGRSVGLKREADGSFRHWVKQAEGEIRTLHASATISTNLAQVSQAVGVPSAVLAEAVSAFSYEIDFQRDIHPHNRFDFLYEVTRDEHSGEVMSSRLLRASIGYRDKSMLVYRYEGAEDGNRNVFYHEDGSSVVRSLLRTPVNAMRISSRFGKRRDPILGYTRMHRGVDFAAPPGTPVYAAGGGVVERASWYGNYGRYVRVRHSGGYSTAYAHLSKFAKGIKAGIRVHQGQVIGYVGSSGRSTGPHLHFEVLKHKARVNPLKLALPSGKKLKGKQMEDFQRQLLGLESLHLAALKTDYPKVVVATELNAQGGP